MVKYRIKELFRWYLLDQWDGGQRCRANSVPRLDSGAYRFKGEDGAMVNLPYVSVNALHRL